MTRFVNTTNIANPIIVRCRFHEEIVFHCNVRNFVVRVACTRSDVASTIRHTSKQHVKKWKPKKALSTSFWAAPS